MMQHRFAVNSFAYKQTIKESENPRQIERRVFAQITRELEAYGDARGDGKARPVASEALARNQALWGHLMFDVMDTANSLPDALKARIISLALFVDRYTGDVLRGEKSVAPLVELNRCIMQGLDNRMPDLSGPEPAHGT
ncbi:MAG: flagellar biosynthesis regulator FlaF [Alphaproteobacteria bacterium]